MNFCTYLTIYAGEKLPPFYIGSTYTQRIIKKKYHGTVRSREYENIWKQELRDNPNLFFTIILTCFDTRNEAFNHERYLHEQLDVVKSNLFINKSLARENFISGSISEEARARLVEIHNQPEVRAKKSRAIKRTLAQRTPEEKEATRQKIIKYHATKSEQAAKQRALRASIALKNRSEEARAASMKKLNETLAKKSKEEKEKSLKKRKETLAKRTPEQIAVSLQQRKETYANKTEEERRAMLIKNGNAIKAGHAKRTLEQKEQTSRKTSESLKLNNATWSDEKRALKRERQKAAHARRRAQKLLDLQNASHT